MPSAPGLWHSASCSLGPYLLGLARGLGGPLSSATRWRPALGQCRLAQASRHPGGSKDALPPSWARTGPTGAMSPSCEMSWSIWDWGWWGAVKFPLGGITRAGATGRLHRLERIQLFFCPGPPGPDVGGHKGGWSGWGGGAQGWAGWGERRAETGVAMAPKPGVSSQVLSSSLVTT